MNSTALDHILSEISWHCERLQLPVRRDGRLMVFSDKHAAVQACSYGLFAVDETPDETPLGDGITGVEAFAGMERFTVAWEAPALV